MKNLLSAFVIAAVAFSSSVFAADAPANNSAKPVAAATAAKPSAQASQESVNINSADVQALTKLKGVGAKKAEAIIAWRKANGAFKSVDQLAEVKGIGAKTVEANRKIIHI